MRLPLLSNFAFMLSCVKLAVDLALKQIVAESYAL